MTHPLMFFRLLIAAFLLCLGVQHAFAQKVLLLTTNVTDDRQLERQQCRRDRDHQRTPGRQLHRQ
jgi:hypothetical protein